MQMDGSRLADRVAASGCIAAWRVERSLRERAVGMFSYSGRILVVNSNLSQFIFCSEII
jgi:hypothetical protein